MTTGFDIFKAIKDQQDKVSSVQSAMSHIQSKGDGKCRYALETLHEKLTDEILILDELQSIEYGKVIKINSGETNHGT